jgi:hypothetical protein
MTQIRDMSPGGLLPHRRCIRRGTGGRLCRSAALIRQGLQTPGVPLQGDRKLRGKEA